MTSHLVCRPEQDLPVAVLRVRGDLDGETSDALRRAVARCLVTQPEAVLVDLGPVRIADEAALGVLVDLMTDTQDWPDVPVVLCGPGKGAIDLDCERITSADDCDDALAAIADEPEPRRIRVRLRPVPDACRQVRQLVSQACGTWHRSEAAATASLVATELVANVVRHAHTTMDFTLGLRNNKICMTVRDGSRRLPLPAEPGLRDAGGRGLRLVRELTESW
ncbi:STAS domain-containing protein, partial [Actinoplanes sp. NPDC051633]|uniref:STAS domain-containing protein n=1 Tax=Actinoplanes sp. NPDC051633 TaxID=3155670 RepID=UPI003423EA45